MSLLDFPHCASCIAKTFDQDKHKDVPETDGPFHIYYQVFRCKAIPTITLTQYFTNLVKRTHPTVEAMLHAVVYLHRLTQFSTDKRRMTPPLYLNAHTIHRLLCTCLLLALKYIDERNISAIDYAPAANITQVKEVVLQEKCALEMLEYRLHVSMEELVAAQLYVTGKNGSFTSALLSIAYYPNAVYLKIMYAINAERDTRERAVGVLI